MSLSLFPPEKRECCINDGAGDGGSGDTDRNDGDRSDASTCISALALCVSGRAIPQRRRRHGDLRGRRHALAPPAAKTMQQRPVGVPHVMANTAARFRYHPLDDGPHGGGTPLLPASASAAAATATAAAAAAAAAAPRRQSCGSAAADAAQTRPRARGERGGRGTAANTGWDTTVADGPKSVLSNAQLSVPFFAARARGWTLLDVKAGPSAEIAVHLRRSSSIWRHGDIVFFCTVFARTPDARCLEIKL